MKTLPWDEAACLACKLRIKHALQWEYMSSDEHKAEQLQELIDSTHPDIDPPWEDD